MIDLGDFPIYETTYFTNVYGMEVSLAQEQMLTRPNDRGLETIKSAHHTCGLGIFQHIRQILVDYTQQMRI